MGGGKEAEGPADCLQARGEALGDPDQPLALPASSRPQQLPALAF